MLKLLIADSSDEFRSALAQQVGGAYVIRFARQGKETLELLRTFRPDLMVLDMTMPELDGISLLKQAIAEGICPVVLATSRFVNDYVQEAAARLGVGYLMVKPCDIAATAERLSDLCDGMKPAAAARPDPRTAVSNILLQLNLPAQRRGYGMVRECILIAMRRSGQMITKEIYPAVARMFEANPAQVERAVRTIIAVAFAQRDENVWQQYFRSKGGILKKPSNGNFIATIAERMRNDGYQI